MLFVSFVGSITLFALVTAVLFTLFWTGVALLFLVPTLFLTFSVAVLVWLWIVSAFVVARWIYNLVPATAGAGPRRQPSGKQVASSNELKNETASRDIAYPESDMGYRDVRAKSRNRDTTE